MMQEILVVLTVTGAGAYLFRTFFAPSLFRPSRPDVPLRNLVRRRSAVSGRRSAVHERAPGPSLPS